MTEQAKSPLSPATQEWLKQPALNPKDLLPIEPQAGLVGELALYLAQDAGVNFDCFQTLASHPDVAIGKKTPVSRLRHYTNRLFRMLQALNLTEETAYPPIADLEQLDGTSLSQLYLKATQTLIERIDQPNGEVSLLENPTHQEFGQTKLDVVLTAVTRSTEFTGWLLKFIDKGRRLGHVIQRPQSLDDVWGPETHQTVKPQKTDEITNQWLQYEQTTTENLMAYQITQLPLMSLKTIGQLLKKATVANRNLYRELMVDKLLKKRFGEKGNRVAVELPHEVNNVINRLNNINPQGQYPSADVVFGLSFQDQLHLYIVMTKELLHAYEDPAILDKTFTSWNKTKTGRQKLIDALRHASQHRGTLAAFFEQKQR